LKDRNDVGQLRTTVAILCVSYAELTAINLSVRSQAPNDPRPPPHADALQQPRDGPKITAKASPTVTTGKSARGGPKTDVQAAERMKTGHPSPQLLDYLITPSNAEHYTGAQGTAGPAAVGVRHKNMKEFLEGWQKGWEDMSAARGQVKADACGRQEKEGT
jgi:hypothetical protein